MKRRVLSMLLCLAMALSLLPMSALAAESKTTPAWAQAYRKCIQDDFNKQEQEYGRDDWPYEGYSCCLLNVDKDDIPELWIVRPSAAAGGEIYTFTNGSIYSQFLDGHGSLSYLPREGIMLDSGGHMDVYQDIVYRLKNGQFIKISQGNFGAEDNSNVQYDKDGFPIYRYFWNRKSF